MAVSIIPNKKISPISKSSSSSSSSSNSRCFNFIIHYSLSSHYNFYFSNSNLSYINTRRTRPTHSPPFFHCSYRRFYGHIDDDDGGGDVTNQLHQFNNHHNKVEGEEEEEEEEDYYSFNQAVELFNRMDYYKCHDFLEQLWNESPNDLLSTLFHAILQCSVGFHHLFNHNHRGAMLELGEGLCKLRKFNFQTGPFLQFELEITASLDFIYQTQLELAACSDDLCLAMDQTERSYQLLGGYAAGQRLYCLGTGPNETMYIIFCPERSYSSGHPPRVKLPTLHATEEHLSSL